MERNKTQVMNQREQGQKIYWDEWAKQYPDPFDSVHRAKDLSQLKLVAKDIAEKLCLTQEDLLLDIGCGSGKLSQELVPFVKQVEGVDGSEEILKIARASTQGIHYQQGECTRIPFGDCSVDKIICYGLLQHCGENSADLLREIRRVVRPGGRVLIGDIPDKRYKFFFYLEILKQGLGLFLKPKVLFGKFLMAKEMKTELEWFNLDELAQLAETFGWKAKIMRQPVNCQYGWKTYTHRFDLVLWDK